MTEPKPPPDDDADVLPRSRRLTAEESSAFRDRLRAALEAAGIPPPDEVSEDRLSWKGGGTYGASIRAPFFVPPDGPELNYGHWIFGSAGSIFFRFPPNDLAGAVACFVEHWNSVRPKDKP